MWLDQAKEDLLAFRMLHVKGQAPLVPVNGSEEVGDQPGRIPGPGPLDLQHLGTHIGQK